MARYRIVVVLLATVTVLLVVAGFVVAQVRPQPPTIAFLVRADSAADGTAAAAVAAQLGGAVLLTPGDRLDPATSQHLRQLAPELVVLVGGTAALSRAVESQVRAGGYDTRRVAGPDRHSTAVALAGLLQEYPSAFVPAGRMMPGHLVFVGGPGIRIIAACPDRDWTAVGGCEDRGEAQLGAVPLAGEHFGGPVMVDYRFTVEPGRTVCLRLAAFDTAQPMEGTEVCRTNTTGATERHVLQVGPVTVPAGLRDWVVEIRRDDLPDPAGPDPIPRQGWSGFVYGVRLIPGP